MKRTTFFGIILIVIAITVFLESGAAIKPTQRMYIDTILVKRLRTDGDSIRVVSPIYIKYASISTATITTAAISTLSGTTGANILNAVTINATTISSTGAINTTGEIQSNGARVGYNLESHSTSESMLANNWDITSSHLTINQAGTYLISLRGTLTGINAQFAPSMTFTNTTFYLRRTNNTAGTIANSTVSSSFKTDNPAGIFTGNIASSTWNVVYTTTNTNDVLTIVATLDLFDVLGGLTSGIVNTTGTIIAVRLY